MIGLESFYRWNCHTGVSLHGGSEEKGIVDKKKWGIVADSGCDYMPGELDDADIMMDTVPFAILIGGEDYPDTEDLDTLAVCDAIEQNEDTGKTACPAPGAYRQGRCPWARSLPWQSRGRTRRSRSPGRRGAPRRR